MRKSYGPYSLGLVQRPVRHRRKTCARCGERIEQDMVGRTDVCGSCADDLRSESLARAAERKSA